MSDDDAADQETRTVALLIAAVGVVAFAVMHVRSSGRNKSLN